MKVFENGIYRNLTAEEISVMQVETAKAEATERHRPLTEQEVNALFIRQSINALEVDDQTAVRMISFYPEWQSNTAYPTGHKVQRNGKLCRCIQAHTSQAGWEPENAASLWEYINEVYAGDLYDPIPYEGNMALSEGLYYNQDGVTYLCTRSTGQPVYNALSKLVGLYVEVAVE